MVFDVRRDCGSNVRGVSRVRNVSRVFGIWCEWGRICGMSIKVVECLFMYLDTKLRGSCL